MAVGAAGAARKKEGGKMKDKRELKMLLALWEADLAAQEARLVYEKEFANADAIENTKQAFYWAKRKIIALNKLLAV